MTAMSFVSSDHGSIADRARFGSNFRLSLPHRAVLSFGQSLRLALAALTACSLAGVPLQGAWAQGLPRTASPPNATEYFIDLKDGQHVPLKLHVRMGLDNMGIAPAGVDFPGTGHHHIIIDAPLPPLDRPIPSDDNHVHLGAGQTETDITLAPGPHTLQLLMGDKNHIPHKPPVHSKLIHVIAALPRLKAPPDAGVYFVTLKDGEKVSGTVTVRFGLRSNMGVAPASVNRPNTGYHNLVVDADTPDVDKPLPKDAKHRSFSNGDTETDLTLPPGQHTLQLVFTDREGKNFDPPIQSSKITVSVQSNQPVRR